ncbi:MAG: hypothetical protein U0359_39625 [Byssovorax sp.]
MSLVRLVKQEMQVWKHAWMPVDTYLDRIDEVYEQDELYATKMSALLVIAAAIEKEKRLRDGIGLFPPLELAADDDPFPIRFDQRLPGQYDLDVAVALFTVKADADGTVTVSLEPRTWLFSYFDDKQGKPVDRYLPSYSFGDVASDFLPKEGVNVSAHKSSLFDAAQRASAATTGLPSLWKWSELEASRRDVILAIVMRAELFESLRAHGKMAYSDGPRSWMSLESLLAHQYFAAAAERAGALKLACTNGSTKLNEAKGKLVGEDLGDKLTTDQIDNESKAMAARATAYGKIQSLLDGTKLFDQAKLQEQLDIVKRGPNDALATELREPIDEAVAARIAYPDGPLRILRMLESSFARFWTARLPWFAARKLAYLDRLLDKKFLQTFQDELSKVIRKQGTSFPLRDVALDLSNSPAPVGATWLQLAAAPGGGKPNGWDQVAPGQIAFIDGPRRTLVVVLGGERRRGKRTPKAEADEDLYRLKICPLQVSIARGAAPESGVAGMLTEPSTIGPGPVFLAVDDVRRGSIAGAPEHNGLMESLLTHWSRLRLLRGKGKVEDLPSSLDMATTVEISGELRPHDNRLVIEIEKLPAGLQPTAREAPILARPGELLLVRGSGPVSEATGVAVVWQGVVEVVAIARMQTKEEAPPLVALRGAVCCEEPGDYLVIQVKDTAFPVVLTEVTLHRNFTGFGTPSLAVGKLLPSEIDPESHDDPEVDRSPELKAACAVLASWMWEAT